MPHQKSCRNKPGQAQVEAPLKFKKKTSFLNMQRTLFLHFYQFLNAENTTKDTHKTRKPRFPQLKTQEKIFLIFFGKVSMCRKKELSTRKTIFSQAEISYESRSLPFDQRKVTKEDCNRLIQKK